MNDETLLLRQINPKFANTDGVSSQAFTPTKDNEKLSVYDGDQFAAETSWRHFTTQLNYKSAGVLGLTVCECKSRNLTVVRDDIPFKGHAAIDFSSIQTNSEIKRTARDLRRIAYKRGWLYKQSDCD